MRQGWRESLSGHHLGVLGRQATPDVGESVRPDVAAGPVRCVVGVGRLSPTVEELDAVAFVDGYADSRPPAGQQKLNPVGIGHSDATPDGNVERVELAAFELLASVCRLLVGGGEDVYSVVGEGNKFHGRGLL